MFHIYFFFSIVPEEYLTLRYPNQIYMSPFVDKFEGMISWCHSSLLNAIKFFSVFIMKMNVMDLL